MKNRRSLWILAAMLTCCAIAGCAVTLGPQTKTEYKIVHAGKPLEVLENVKVKARVLDGSGDAVTQDIGGWICMPPDHWEAVKRALEKAN